MLLHRPIQNSIETREPFQPSGRALAAAVLAVAATYFYFLIFAQFGFLKAVQAVVGADGGRLRPIMAVMGGCGMAGSVATAWLYAEERGRALMALGFALAAMAAGMSLFAVSPSGLFCGAALTGAGTGIITVTLAAMLRREVGERKLGLGIGAGTGLAYGLCNLPFVFEAGAPAQAILGLAACGAGAVAVMNFTQRAPQPEAVGFEYRPVVVVGWVVMFLSLVWLDSAAFYVIQNTPGLKGGMWGGVTQLYLNALVHVVAALLAGLLLDRRWMGGAVLLAVVSLVVACALLRVEEGALATAAFFYVTGVSFYSTALVFYVARGGQVGLAALVYSVAGWGGSALGIGMAKNLGAVPAWFIVTAGIVMVGGLFCVLAAGGVALPADGVNNFPRSRLPVASERIFGAVFFLHHAHSRFLSKPHALFFSPAADAPPRGYRAVFCGFPGAFVCHPAGAADQGGA